MTGKAVPALEPFDETMTAFMRARKAPGGALAVVKDGRLIYARGYGWADRENRVPVQPTSLFRLASIAKPITAVAVMTLVQDHPRYGLTLDTPVFPLLGLTPHWEPGAKPDPRLQNVTLRHLLQHAGGWDRAESGDPMFRSVQIAEALGTKPPADADAILRYMLGRLLDFDPGMRDAYSNFGYCVLGRVIEKATGKGYETYVRESVLAPMGIKHMRVGRSLARDRFPEEVRYYGTDRGEAKPVFASVAEKTVPWPYGGFCLEAMDAHGGWLASAVELARFAAALDVPRGRALLTPSSVRAMYARPAPPLGRDKDGRPSAAYYACGWMVRPVGSDGKANYWHNGSLPGTYTLLVRRHDGLSWCVLFNQQSQGDMPPDGEIDGALHRAAARVTAWPAHDLFADYR